MPSFFVLVAAVVIADVPANQADKAPCPNTTTGPKIKDLKKHYVCKCPDGWILKSKGCYKVLDGRYNHNEGSSACEALHSESHLPILIDKQDMDDLNAVRKSQKIDEWIWLDGDDLSDPGKYKVGSYLYQKCEPPYQGWGPTEPNNLKSLEDCLAISSKVNYTMADGNCRVKIPVICQIPFLNACKPDEIITSLCKSKLMKNYLCRCPIGWTRQSKGCYKVIDGIYNYTEGRTACESLHAESHLPVLIDDEDMDDLNAIRESQKIDKWIWLDGDDLSYPGKYKVGSYLNQACEPPYQEGWGCGEPSNATSLEDCLAISSKVNYKMADGNCRFRIPVICQIPFLNACKPDEIITSLCGLRLTSDT